jgi:hypothetical protein
LSTSQIRPARQLVDLTHDVVGQAGAPVMEILERIADVDRDDAGEQVVAFHLDVAHRFPP